jgi:uncharacterized protein
MSRWFVDTYYLVALLSPDDEGHAKALAFAKQRRGRFFTTQWIFMELLDGFADTAYRSFAVEFLETFTREANVSVVPASNDWFTRRLRLYQERPDKEWSLTDCISFLVMQDLGIQEALTTDHHFEQAGFTALLKDQATP